MSTGAIVAVAVISVIFALLSIMLLQIADKLEDSTYRLTTAIFGWLSYIVSASTFAGGAFYAFGHRPGIAIISLVISGIFVEFLLFVFVVIFSEVVLTESDDSDD